MNLRDVLSGVERAEVRGPDVEITSISADSRLVEKGGLFVAVPGLQKDGASFIDAAIERGAFAIVREGPAVEELAATKVTTVLVDDARSALSRIAASFYGHPASKLSIVGVTGTSGKTTTTKMIESIFDATGEPVGLIGTIEYRAGDERLMADRTTPDAIVLHDWFARMVKAGVRHAVMEVSSHALALKRTAGIAFAAAVFTNLSRDHFDFHRDFEDYFAAKKILFDQIDRSRTSAIVNVDDSYGARLASELGDAAWTFGLSPGASIHPGDGFEVSVHGLRGVVVTPRGEIRVASPLLGTPNLYNWLAAIGAALLVGIPIEAIERGIEKLDAVRGRFEPVPSADGPTVIVDYAHKPDALEKLLHAVRELSGGRRLTILFGCGGDRDQGKRPEMGEIAARLADRVILTSDNPRSEEPSRILDEIEAGVKRVPGADYRRVEDRRQAIAAVLAEASDADVIVIAGKGHEPYQVIRDQVLHFDDREEAELALKKRGEKIATK